MPRSELHEPQENMPAPIKQVKVNTKATSSLYFSALYQHNLSAVVCAVTGIIAMNFLTVAYL